MQSLVQYIIAAPILLPLLTAAGLLLMGEGRRSVKAVINTIACVIILAVALALVWSTSGTHDARSVGVYLAGNWRAPYGIVLVVDRLSAMMLTLTAVLALAACVYAQTRWHRAGVHFHALFQLQLMGLNGAFLTGDLFNLFVFFEIMLTASYGLLLHGSGWGKVKAGLHVIAINLMAATLFLIGAALIYGVTGTLNLADMAIMASSIPLADRGLLHAGAAILAVAFLAKAGAWPMAFWLPGAYTNAAAPVAALFAVMTKLGVYALLRVWTLLFNINAAPSSGFGEGVLAIIGIATLGFGAVGILATRNLGRMTAFGVIVSSGTLLTALSFNNPSITAAALYYAVASTLALGALFLLIELIDRARQAEVQPHLVSESLKFAPDRILSKSLAFQSFSSATEPSRPLSAADMPDVNLDDAGQAITGIAIPAAMAFLGLAFMACGLTLAGLPPLPGFIGKFTMLSTLLSGSVISTAGWMFFTLLLVSGLFTLLAISRAGVRIFWIPRENVPRLLLAETLPIAFLAALLLALTVDAGPALRYANDTARALYPPYSYVDAVITARPRPSPKDSQEDAQ
jgi:multicomponent K+:H+ antiporter subunit D